MKQSISLRESQDITHEVIKLPQNLHIVEFLSLRCSIRSRSHRVGDDSSVFQWSIRNCVIYSSQFSYVEVRKHHKSTSNSSKMFEAQSEFIIKEIGIWTFYYTDQVSQEVRKDVKANEFYTPRKVHSIYHVKMLSLRKLMTNSTTQECFE